MFCLSQKCFCNNTIKNESGLLGTLNSRLSGLPFAMLSSEGALSQTWAYKENLRKFCPFAKNNGNSEVTTLSVSASIAAFDQPR